jgi:hypothetical protein
MAWERGVLVGLRYGRGRRGRYHQIPQMSRRRERRSVVFSIWQDIISEQRVGPLEV